MSNDIKTKICCYCHKEKNVNEFHKCNGHQDNLDCRCKTCKKQLGKIYNSEHKDQYSLWWKQYYPKHKKEIKLYSKQWYSEHKDEILLKNKQHRLEHKDKINLKRKQYRAENKEKTQLQSHQHYLRHKDQIHIRHKKYQQNKMKTDVNYRIYRMCQNMVNNALNGEHKKCHTMEYFMCSHEEFKHHIERLWLPGMTWKNRGNGIGKWNVDHIIPCSFFKDHISDEVEKYMCCRYQNLQPLWWKDNMAKGTKIIEHLK